MNRSFIITTLSAFLLVILLASCGKHHDEGHGHDHGDHRHDHSDHGHAHDDHGHPHDDHGAHDGHDHAAGHDDHDHGDHAHPHDGGHDGHAHPHNDHGHDQAQGSQGVHDHAAPSTNQDHHGHDHGAHDHDHPHDDHGHDHTSNNSITVNEASRQNLSIRFAAAETRAVLDTLLIPGQLESVPQAVVHYPAAVAGLISVHVAPLDLVQVGDPLYAIEAPAWRELQQQLIATQDTVMRGELTAREAKAIAAAVDPLLRAEASNMADPHAAGANSIYQQRATAAQASLVSARLTVDQLLAQAATMTGLSIDTLTTPNDDGQPHWMTITDLVVTAKQAGLVGVVAVATGSWVEVGAHVTQVVDPHQLRFRGTALQADLGSRLRNGQQANLLPPVGFADAAPSLTAVKVGISGNATRRTIDIFAAVPTDDRTSTDWLRPGLSVTLEVMVAGDKQPQLAVPNAAIIQDGLEHLIFRRDAHHPDKIYRTPITIVTRGPRYTAISGNVEAGDEIVVDGVYQLKLASSSNQADTKGVHVHADGTVHEAH